MTRSGASNGPACSDSGGDSEPDLSSRRVKLGAFQAPSPSRTGSDPGDSEPAPHCRPCFAASALMRTWRLGESPFKLKEAACMHLRTGRAIDSETGCAL